MHESSRLEISACVIQACHVRASLRKDWCRKPTGPKAMAEDTPASMREMLDLAKGLAHDGTVEGTMRALELVTNMIR